MIVFRPCETQWSFKHNHPTPAHTKKKTFKKLQFCCWDIVNTGTITNIPVNTNNNKLGWRLFSPLHFLSRCLNDTPWRSKTLNEPHRVSRSTQSASARFFLLNTPKKPARWSSPARSHRSYRLPFRVILDYRLCWPSFFIESCLPFQFQANFLTGLF